MSWVQINSYLARPENMSAGFSLKQVCGIIAFPEISAFKILWSCSSCLSSFPAELRKFESVVFVFQRLLGKVCPKKRKKMFFQFFFTLFESIQPPDWHIEWQAAVFSSQKGTYVTILLADYLSGCCKMFFQSDVLLNFSYPQNLPTFLKLSHY